MLGLALSSILSPANLIWTSRLALGLGSSSRLKSGASFHAIRHRQWIYSIELVRGEITVLASPGGVGKSSKALGDAVCIATGKELLHAKIYGKNLKCLYINAEDARVEMLRRLWGFCIEHRVRQQDLTRLTLLGADDWQVQRLSFLRAEKTLCLLDQGGVDAFEALLHPLRPDLVVLDPMVSLCAGGNLNDNAAMALVMRAIKRLATKYDCAVLLIHHTRKGGDLSSADAIGGAAAIVNLARRAVMLVPMSPEEAKALGVLPSQRSRYLKLMSVKSNLAPPATEIEWFELRSVTLPNSELPIYPNGDCVQAIAVANLPSAAALFGVDLKSIEKAILEVVEIGKVIDGARVPYSPCTTGAGNLRGLKGDAIAAARQVVGPQMHEKDVSVVVDRVIKDLKGSGALVEQEIQSGRFRRGQGLSVDWSKTAWAAEKAAKLTAGAECMSAAADLPEDAQ